MDSYGGAPGATGYVGTIILSGADGTQVKGRYNITPNSWNQLSLDMSGWSGRNAVKTVTVTFAALGSDYPTWDPKFQIENVGYFSS
jgi:hypothetical protein